MPLLKMRDFLIFFFIFLKNIQSIFYKSIARMCLLTVRNFYTVPLFLNVGVPFLFNFTINSSEDNLFIQKVYHTIYWVLFMFTCSITCLIFELMCFRVLKNNEH